VNFTGQVTFVRRELFKKYIVILRAKPEESYKNTFSIKAWKTAKRSLFTKDK